MLTKRLIFKKITALIGLKILSMILKRLRKADHRV